MKAKFVNYYRKDAGKKVFVYVVSGSNAEIEDYKAAQGENLRLQDEDATKPLFFSMRPLSANPSESITLTITTNGKIVADDSNKVFSQEAKLEEYILMEKAKLMARQEMSSGIANAISSLDDMTASRPVSTEMDDNIPS